MNVMRTTACWLASCTFLLLSPAASSQDVDYTRAFDVSMGARGRPISSTSWVSVPFLPDIPDNANTDAPGPNKCVGDPTGSAEGDGFVNVDDLICHW